MQSMLVVVVFVLFCFFLDIGHYLVVLQDRVNEALCASF